MHARIRLLALLVFGVLAMFGTAFAQTVAETASKWGLLGSWKLDCSQATSRSNGDLRYVVRGGKLFHDREFGDARDSSAVMSATTKADGTIEIVVNFASFSQTRQFSFIKGSDGRIRALSNRNVDTNEYSIEGGKFTANGNDTPWQSRCRRPTADRLVFPAGRCA
jgi:hypothetical protein